jgi:hypothetical protein
VVGILGFALYFFAFGQTYDGEIEILEVHNEPGVIGQVSFQSRFQNRRFLTHSVYLDLAPDTPVTFQGGRIPAEEALTRFSDTKIEARVGYREDKAGWGSVVSLDLDPLNTSVKEVLMVVSLLLIFGCTAGMAVLAKTS